MADQCPQRFVQLDPLEPKALAAFGEALRRKLRGGSSATARRALAAAYFRLLVNEIRVKGKCAKISGSKAALLPAFRENEKGTPE